MGVDADCTGDVGGGRGNLEFIAAAREAEGCGLRVGAGDTCGRRVLGTEGLRKVEADANAQARLDKPSCAWTVQCGMNRRVETGARIKSNGRF